MQPLSRKKRLIENEVIFRTVNENIQEFIEEETQLSSGETISFYCECSRPDCLERIKLTSSEYKKLHKDKKNFIVLIGHEFPEVERVIEKSSNYEVVEKHFNPPKAKDIDLALNSINKSLPTP
jgi:hypothetical protein